MKDYSKIEVYSDVEKIGFLPKKSKYTMRDVNNLMVNSLFLDTERTLDKTQAAFVVKCSAVFHKTSYSNAVASVSAIDDYIA